MGIIICFASNYVEKTEKSPLEKKQLLRNVYGQGIREETLIVNGLFDKPTPVLLPLRERQYEEIAAEKAFPLAYEYLLEQILGQNISLAQVRHKLNLVTFLDKFGISVGWDSKDRNLIDPSGAVFNESCPETGKTCQLTASLRAGAFSREYTVTAIVYPPDRTKEEMKKTAFENFLLHLDEEQAYQEHLTLPDEFEGKTLHYKLKKPEDSWIFLVLGIAAAALLPLREKQNEKDRKKKREQQLLLDYSEVISKLTVFLGAGLPIRMAWERIVKDYEMNEQEKGSRFAYEEMKHAYYLMARGMSEKRAYAEFGNRCRILPYRKLAGILEQNVKNGTEGLRALLETEMAEAFEQRKAIARRMGEEAGTKLLLPLFIMLAVVMVITTVPAFLSFGL